MLQLVGRDLKILPATLSPNNFQALSIWATLQVLKPETPVSQVGSGIHPVLNQL